MATTVLIHEFVTGGGLAGAPLPPSWAAEGRAMRLALAEDFSALDGVSVAATLDHRLPDDPGRWATIRVGPGEEPDRLIELASAHDYTLCVAPETGGVLEDRARRIARAGGRSLGATPEAIALCADKIRTAEFLRAQGLETPACLRVRPRDGLPRDAPYPAVLKPIDGAGSVRTFFVRAPDALPAEALAMGESLLQPFVAGAPMSAAFLAGPDAGPALLGMAEQWTSPPGSHPLYQGGVAPARSGSAEGMAPVREALRAIPGLLGWVGVDFLLDERSGAITVLEINPRVTTSYVAYRRLESPASLPSPWVAELWLSRFGHAPGRPPLHPPLPIADASAVMFLADGTILPRTTPR